MVLKVTLAIGLIAVASLQSTTIADRTGMNLFDAFAPETAMHIPPIEPTEPLILTDVDRVRDRMNQYAPRPSNSVNLTAKSFEPTRDRESPRRHGTGKREGLRLGWRGWLLVEAVAVAVVAGAVLVWPPASDCREHEAKFGFYAGDTLGKCIHRGVAARLYTADQHIKMAMRGSGR